MTFSEFLNPDCFLMLKGSNKAEILEEIIDFVSKRSGFDRKKLAKAVWKREKMMSTGICQGLAIPHVRLPELSSFELVIGICSKKIKDYESLDNHPIQIVVFIAAPEGEHEKYLLLLSKVAEKLKKENIIGAILKEREPEKVYRILKEL